MPTATFTTEVAMSSTPSVMTLKAGSSPPSSSSAAASTSTQATLRSLYSRAARAFLHRDVSLTYSLLTSAFAILKPPSSSASDALSVHRRKWDILRITLETTIYSAPPPLKDQAALPPPLRENLILPSQSLIAMLHTRSVTLFTPASPPHKPSSAFLPSQILLTLVLSSLKLECADVGRGMIEDWLAKRDQYDDPADSEGYEKLLELYCLHVLPRLEEWEYANEFLLYESELPEEKRKNLKLSLDTVHSNALAARMPPPHQSSPSQISQQATSLTPRPSSPALSASSSTSSLSTASTHTAVPRTSRLGRHTPLPNGLHPSRSSTSVSSERTVTQRQESSSKRNSSGSAVTTNGDAIRHSSTSPILRAPRAPTITSSVAQPPSMLTLIRASLQPYLETSKLTTFLLLFVVFPLLSLVFRLRRRRRLAGGAQPGVRGAAELARSQLGGRSVIRHIWNEAVRAITDTVRMGGSGLV